MRNCHDFMVVIGIPYKNTENEQEFRAQSLEADKKTVCNVVYLHTEREDDKMTQKLFLSRI